MFPALAIGPLLVAAVAAVSGLFHLLLLLRRPELRWNGWAALIALSTLLYSASVTLQYAVTDMKWEGVIERLQYTSLLLLIPSCMGFVASFTGAAMRLYNRIAGPVHGVLAVILWLTPWIVTEDLVAREFSFLSRPYVEPELSVFGTLLVAYMAVSVVFAATKLLLELRRRKRGRTVAWGMLIWVVLGIHDALATYGMPTVMFLLEGGFLVFQLSLAWTALVEYTRMLERLEHKKAEIEAETADLKAARDALVREIDTHRVALERTGRDLEQETAARRRAQESADTTRDALATILDSLDADVYVADMKSYEILFMNRHMKESFGEALVGKVCYRVFRGEHAPCAHCTNARLLDASGRPKGATVWEGRNPITGRHYLNLDRAIRWIDGRLVRIQVATDITPLKEAERERQSLEDQLIQAQKMDAVGRLAGGIAHDFNNLLTAILGYADILQDSLSGEAAGHLSEIRASADRATSLTQQLLAFSRKQVMQPRNIDLNQMIREVEVMLRRLIGENVQLVCRVPQDELFVRVDPGQLSQVILNLVVNARDAMPEGGRVVISTGCARVTEERAREWEIEAGLFAVMRVSDNGQGMDEETRRRVFEPFFTTKEVGKGTGLGLSTVFGIITQSGGHVTVTSAPGDGATFEVFLPLVNAGETSDAEPEEPPRPARGRGRILVVEDEPLVQNLVCRALQRRGYAVQPTRDVREALRRLEEEPYDLLITDLVMPMMSGQQLAARARVVAPGMPVLFMSGYPESAGEDVAELSGKAFLRKPFDSETLHTRVAEVLRQTGS